MKAARLVYHHLKQRIVRTSDAHSGTVGEEEMGQACPADPADSSAGYYPGIVSLSGVLATLGIARLRSSTPSLKWTKTSKIREQPGG